MADVKDLRISVIGAGMGGLACALAFAKKGFKKIDVYETASNLGFVGAGIQLAPNLARVLDRWGCWTKIHAEATIVTSSSIREGSTNKELSLVQMPDIADMYGYPHCVGHRASLAGSLFEGCQKEPAITFHFSTALESVESFGPDKLGRSRGHGAGGVSYHAVAVRDGARPRDDGAAEFRLRITVDWREATHRGVSDQQQDHLQPIDLPARHQLRRSP
ncbi:hypothetical protein O1611_g5076 [Lasiodiplodia mahajangana]|uniref:Uncharacterized protein n=1 Tax=Lasiodiplodia mahajangana TaxID=1108764 RepID=A0ACC2JM11_9PEZI|nr:hypothetical protein O1611_g5076 [Lasiodiplodia mahajangana]